MNPNQGRSPENNLALTAGRSHRRTSGGKAVALQTSDFNE